MNDFDVNITCKNCNSKSITVKAMEIYDGDVILSFTCDDCNTTETWGVLNEMD